MQVIRMITLPQYREIQRLLNILPLHRLQRVSYLLIPFRPVLLQTQEERVQTLDRATMVVAGARDLAALVLTFLLPAEAHTTINPMATAVLINSSKLAQ